MHRGAYAAASGRRPRRCTEPHVHDGPAGGGGHHAQLGARDQVTHRRGSRERLATSSAASGCPPCLAVAGIVDGGVEAAVSTANETIAWRPRRPPRR